MRQDVYDVMKGLLIMLVVLGHLFAQGSEERQVIYWFHMPVFFMLTGMLTNWDMDGRKFLSKRIKSYVIPYICWMLLFVFVAYLLYEDSIVKGVAHTLMGGVKISVFTLFHFGLSTVYLCQV